jgi:hypothetical protein
VQLEQLISRERKSGFWRSGLHRIEFDQSYGQKDEYGEPGVESDLIKVAELRFRRNHLADKCGYEAGTYDAEAFHNGGLHGFGVAADENGQADHKHYEVDNGLCDPKMLLAVELA